MQLEEEVNTAILQYINNNNNRYRHCHHYDNNSSQTYSDICKAAELVKMEYQ